MFSKVKELIALYKSNQPKNELIYNPNTWGEWTLDNDVTGDASGLEFIADGLHYRIAKISVPDVKVNTFYGVLYNVVLSTLNHDIVAGNGSMSIFTDVIMPKTVGNQKFTKTTGAIINNKFFQMYVTPQNANGAQIKLINFRIFELPTGSEIEADFTNLPADQLNEKYPF